MRSSRQKERYIQDAFNLVLIFLLVAYSVVCVLAPIIHPECRAELSPIPTDWNNPSYVGPRACRSMRHMSLLGLNLMECDFGSRLVVSAFLGAVIGFERREADRPAGIRTMALASMGASSFTVSSAFGFNDSPMIWDSSRISAAIPSGVGFLGAGIIWKGIISKGNGNNGEHHEVRGLTTAASVWLSAAVGLAVGGGLYMVGALTTVLTIFILRFGPRALSSPETEEVEGDSADEVLEEEEDKEMDKPIGSNTPRSRISIGSAQSSSTYKKSRVLKYIRKAKHASLNPYV